MAWNDEKRAAVTTTYTDTMEKEYDNDVDRAKNSIEVVKELAEIHGETTNGVRQVLSKAGVYYKASVAKAAPKSGASTTRVSKADAILTLRNLILAASNNDEEVIDDEILNKLTGKAAQYFAGVLQQSAGE